jgi:multidrug efflux pump subunit AcrA (membrane-fusion protein)
VSQKRSYYADHERTPGKPWLRVDEADAAVWEAFASLATRPEWVEPLIVRARQQQPHEEINAEICRHQAQIKRNQERLSRLVDMRADGEIERAMYLEKSSELRETIDSAEVSIRELKARLLSSDGREAERVVRAVQTLIGGQSKLDRGQKRAILGSVVRRIDGMAVRADGPRPRGARGRYLAGRPSHWRLREVRFHFDLGGGDQRGRFDTRP